MSHNLSNVKVSRDDARWEAIVSAEIPETAIAKYREETLKDIQKTAKLDGFRPGKAPIDRIVQIYGEDALMKRTLEHAIQSELPELLAKENVLIIEAPKVTMETPVAGKNVAFTARAALAPLIEIAEYKKIAEKHNTAKVEVVVTDDEHAEALTHIRRERARIDKIESGADAQKAHEESRAMKAEELPALDDEFVQALGYENADTFSEALRTNIKSEKEIREQEKKRTLILDELVKDSKVSYPAMLRDYELDDMEARLKDDIERSGSTWEAYLADTKKSAEDIRKSWEDAADKRAKVRLILSEIARQEKIEPDAHALEHELEHAKEQYPQADMNTLRAHISHAMRNEQTLRFLEGNTEKVGHTAHDH